MQFLDLSQHFLFSVVCIFQLPYWSMFVKVSDAECHFPLELMVDCDQALDEVCLDVHGGNYGNVHQLQHTRNQTEYH